LPLLANEAPALNPDWVAAKPMPINPKESIS